MSSTTTVTVFKKKPGPSKPIVVKKPGPKPKPRAKMSGKPAQSLHLAHKVCSISNPFCPEAMGAKLPDQNATPSATYQDRSVRGVVTDANGYAAYYITPNSIEQWLPYTTIASAEVTVWGTYLASNFYTLIGNVCKQYRIVSWGFRYVTTCAYTDATGFINAAEIIGSPVTGNNYVIANMQSGISNHLYPMRDCEIRFVGRPNGDEAMEYIAYNSTSKTPFTGAVLAIAGGPLSKTVGFVEIFVNYEWTIAMSGYTMFATPAAKYDSLAISTRAKLLRDTQALDNSKAGDHAWDLAWVKASAISVGETAKEVISVGETIASYGPTALRVAKIGGALMAMA